MARPAGVPASNHRWIRRCAAGVRPQRQRRRRPGAADDLHRQGGGAALQQLPAGDQRLEHNVGQFDVGGHELPQAHRRHPVYRPGLPRPAQEVDVLPGQQIQLPDKAARINHRDGRGGHVSGRRPDNLHRTPGDHDQICIFVARTEQDIAPINLLRRAIGQKPGEQLIAQPWRCHAGRHQRFAQLSASVAGAQPIQIIRSGPGHRPGQASLAEHRAAPGPGRGAGTRQFIHRCHAFSSPAIWSNVLQASCLATSASARHQVGIRLDLLSRALSGLVGSRRRG